jgi:hypothetical protein
LTVEIHGGDEHVIGREQELGRVRGLFMDSWEERSPRGVVMLGPPGIGKTSMLDAALRRVGGHHALTGVRLRGKLGAARLAPFGEVFRTRADFDPSDRKGRLHRWLQNAWPSIPEAEVPFFWRLAGLEPDDDEPVAARIERCVRWISASCQLWAMVFMVDDVELLEPASWEVVLRAMREPIPVLALVTGGPEAEPIVRPHIESGLFHEMPLRALSRKSSERVLHELRPELSPEARESILSRAAGNPRALLQLA